MWHATYAIIDGWDDPANEDFEPEEFKHHHAKRYSTIARHLDQFTNDLRRYFVLSHTVTKDELSLICGGRRPGDTEDHIFEVSAYYQTEGA